MFYFNQYLVSFILFIIFLIIRLRKYGNTNFKKTKDTPNIIFFMGLTTTVFVFYTPFSYIFDIQVILSGVSYTKLIKDIFKNYRGLIFLDEFAQKNGILKNSPTFSQIGAWIGISIQIVSIIILFLSHKALGKFFSGTLNTPKKLIQNGIYKYFKHPMYIAIFSMFFGLVLCSGCDILLFINFIIAFITLKYRIKVEEKDLEEKFGEVYKKYKKNVKFF